MHKNMIFEDKRPDIKWEGNLKFKTQTKIIRRYKNSDLNFSIHVDVVFVAVLFYDIA